MNAIADASRDEIKARADYVDKLADGVANLAAKMDSLTRRADAMFCDTQIEPNYKNAMAAGQDAGNRQMKKEGRTKWNEKDYNLAAETAKKIMGAS